MLAVCTVCTLPSELLQPLILETFDHKFVHIFCLLGGSPPPADGNSKPSFLSDQELKHLVLEVSLNDLHIILLFIILILSLFCP